jgi:hypothetical protein
MKMNRIDFSLIDLMTGIDALSLYNRLTPSQFTFFVGLILKSNRLRQNGHFPKSIILTNAEAMSLGGGQSRQNVNKLRTALSKFKIDGVPLLTIKPGKKLKNIAAKYEISYKILVAYSPTYQGFTEQVSTIVDGGVDGVVDATVPDPLTIPKIREEKKKEEGPRDSDQLLDPDEVEKRFADVFRAMSDGDSKRRMRENEQ